MQVDALRHEYDRLKSHAEVLAGGLNDIQRRVSILQHLYLESQRNHPFCHIAAHGALWAMGYFESGGSLGRLIARRYFYSARELAFRMGILREFAEAFRRVNRTVCVDTYANYQFSRRYGREPAAAEIMPPQLLEALNRVHHAVESRRALSASEKREVFQTSFHFEQEITVAPGVAEAVAGFDCRIMRILCLRPIVRFAYFPTCRYLLFRDFASKDERIAKGLRAYEIAERRGWDTVEESLQWYGRMSGAFFEDPAQHYRSIEEEVIETGRIARDFAADAFPADAEGSTS